MGGREPGSDAVQAVGSGDGVIYRAPAMSVRSEKLPRPQFGSSASRVGSWREARCTPSLTTASRPGAPLGDSLDLFVRREDAERFIEEIRGDDPQLAKPLRIEERELEAGGGGEN
jgi:hypothetical protein